MKTIFIANSSSNRVQMDVGGLTRFTSISHVIMQAARNGQRRLLTLGG